jgi:hypothetical protein
MGPAGLVLKWDQRDVDTHHLAKLAGPHTSSVHNYFALDLTLVGIHGCHLIALELKPGHKGLLVNLCAAVPRPFCHSQSQAAGIGLSVRGHKSRSDHPIQAYYGEEIQGLLW